MESSSPVHLDILHAQTEPKESATLISPFAQMPRPTELSPLRPVVLEDAPAPVKKEEGFVVSRDLLSYIDKLIMNGMKLRAFRFDIEDADSNEEIKKIIEKHPIPDKEKDCMLGFLRDSEIESNKNLSVPEISKEVGGGSIRERRIKSNNLKDNHGIVVHNTENFTELEENIKNKVLKLWEKDNSKTATVAKLLKGELDFEQEVAEASIELPPVRKEVPVEPAPQIVEIAETPIPVRIQEEVPSVLEQKVLDEPVIEEKDRVAKIFYEGGDIEIHIGQTNESGDNTIKVTFGEQEIGSGVMTKRGPMVKIDEQFKSGWFLKDTPQEKAFAKAMQFVKNFQRP